METSSKEIWLASLWKNNPAFVQLLGLCPLLATTTSATTALGLGFTTMLVMVLSNVIISLGKDYIPNEIRIPIFVIVIATMVTVMQLFINSFAYSLYLSLGIFLPLIVTNCIVIGRIEAFAYKNKPAIAAIDGLAMGVGMMLALVMLGAIREIIGQGTLFKGLDLIFGNGAKDWYFEIFHTKDNFILATLAPGAFIFLAIIIALKNYFQQRSAAKQQLKLRLQQAQAQSQVQV